MTQEEYRAKKLEELKTLIKPQDMPIYPIDIMDAVEAEAFLSQTIDELYGCLPKERKFCQRNECSPRSVSIESGFNECCKEFEENLNKVS